MTDIEKAYKFSVRDDTSFGVPSGNGANLFTFAVEVEQQESDDWTVTELGTTLAELEAARQANAFCLAIVNVGYLPNPLDPSEAENISVVYLPIVGYDYTASEDAKGFIFYMKHPDGGEYTLRIGANNGEEFTTFTTIG